MVNSGRRESLWKRREVFKVESRLVKERTMREASGEYVGCLEEKGLLVEEEVLIVDCGSLKIKGIPWKGGYIDGRGWWVMIEELWTAIVHWFWIETGGSCSMLGSGEVNCL